MKQILLLMTLILTFMITSILSGCNNTEPTKKECTEAMIHVSEMTKKQYVWCKGKHCAICMNNGIVYRAGRFEEL